MNVVLIIPAAGSGTRLGADVPKAFVELRGRTLLEHCLRRALASGVIDRVVIASAPGWEEHARSIASEVACLPGEAAGEGRDSCGEGIEGVGRGRGDARGADDSAGEGARRGEVPIGVITGGADRIASVSAGFEAAVDAGGVLVHDAARCLTPPQVFVRVVRALRCGAQAVIPVLPVVDTITTVAGVGPGGGERVTGGLDRAGLRRVQTPQGFDAAVLRGAHDLQRHQPNPAATDDAGIAERWGAEVEAVAGDERAMKITYPIDMTVAAALLQEEL